VSSVAITGLDITSWMFFPTNTLPSTMYWPFRKNGVEDLEYGVNVGSKWNISPQSP
jgi:hypothetical protein